MDLANRPDGVAPSAAEMAAGLAGLPNAGLEVAGVAVDAPPLAPKVAAAVRWLTDKKMAAPYELEFPFAIGEPADELEVRTIVVRRMTAARSSR